MNTRTRHAAWTLVTHTRPWLLALCTGTATVIVLAGWALHGLAGPHPVRVVTYAIGVVVSFAWALGGARLLLVHRALQQARVPGSTRQIRTALILLVLLLPGLPFALLTLGAGAHALALAMLLFAGLAGLLWAIGPWWLAVLMPILLFSGLQLLVTLQLPIRASGLWALDALLLAYAVLRWRQLLALDTRGLSCRALPVIMRLGDGQLFTSQAIARTIDARQLRWPSLRPRLHGLGRQRPVRSLRIWLGQPFAPMGLYGLLRADALLWLLAAGALLGAAALHWPVAIDWVAFWFVLPAFIVTALLARVQLYALFVVKRHGEVAELALLPGLGAAATARRTLLRATLGPVTGSLGLFTLGAVLVALALDAPLRVWLGLLVLGLASTAWYVTNVLRVLGTCEPMEAAYTRRRMARRLAVQFPVLMLFTLTAMADLIGTVDATVLAPYRALIGRGLALIWAVLLVVWTAKAVRYWQRFQHRPHPFLQH